MNPFTLSTAMALAEKMPETKLGLTPVPSRLARAIAFGPLAQ